MIVKALFNCLSLIRYLKVCNMSIVELLGTLIVFVTSCFTVEQVPEILICYVSAAVFKAVFSYMD